MLVVLLIILFSVVYGFTLSAEEHKKAEMNKSPFTVVQEDAKIYTKDGDIKGTIVRDKETGKEYIIIHQFLSDKMIPRGESK